MSADEHDHESFEETVREIAREVGQSMERAMEQFDLDDIAGTIGVDADRAREWVDSAGSWLRSQVERLGDEMASQSPPRAEEPPRAQESPPVAPEDPWRSAAPHPLDLPTEEQGLALAALDSGRWEVEPGTNRLSPHGQGPAPRDAMGLVEELRARDWITAEGTVTLVGRHAVGRWLST